MTAEDFDRDVENVGRLPGKSEVQGSTGLLLATIYLSNFSITPGRELLRDGLLADDSG
jgi:hypothetical protein